MMWKKSWNWRATTNDAHKWSGRMAPWCTSHGNTSQWDAAEWDQEIQKKCPGICCPINCWCSYKLRKKASKKHSAVTELRKKGRFDVVAHRLPQAPVDERPMEMTLGLDLMYAEVCKCIEDEQLGIIGLYGMGVPEKLPSWANWIMSSSEQARTLKSPLGL